jgi:hypothetical protein
MSTSFAEQDSGPLAQIKLSQPFDSERADDSQLDSLLLIPDREVNWRCTGQR